MSKIFHFLLDLYIPSAGARALPSWCAGAPQQSTEQGGGRLVSCVQVAMALDPKNQNPCFRFSPEGRELAEFQTRCNEYETDPEVGHRAQNVFLFLTILSQNSLATVPMAILKKENGSKVGILVGEDR